MLAYIRYDNCVVRSVGVNSFNNLLRINIIINLILNERAFPIVDFRNPLIVLNLVNSFGKKRQNLFKIAVNMIMRNNIFIHFGRVYINMKHLCLGSEFCSVAGNAIGESCSAGDKNIALRSCFIGFKPAVHAHQAHIEPVIMRKRTETHK